MFGGFSYACDPRTYSAWAVQVAEALQCLGFTGRNLEVEPILIHKNDSFES